jgi:hypothetical protein
LLIGLIKILASVGVFYILTFFNSTYHIKHRFLENYGPIKFIGRDPVREAAGKRLWHSAGSITGSGSKDCQTDP